MRSFQELTNQLIANKALPQRDRVSEAIALLDRAGFLRSTFLMKASSGQSELALFELLVALGRADLSIARLYEGHVNAFQLIARLGDRDQFERANGVAINGGLLSIWGADDPSAPGRIEISNGCYRLSGKKTYASGIEIVSLALIAVKNQDRKTQLVMLERHALKHRVDLSSWNPIGMKATGSFSVDINGIAGSADDLLGAPSDYETPPFFGAGAIRFVSAQLGGLIAVFDVVKAHLQATARYENAHQAARLAHVLAETECIYSYVRNAYSQLAPAIGWSAQPADSNCGLIADSARIALEATADRILPLAIKSIGCSGLIEDHDLARAITDLTVYLRQPNPDGAAVRVGIGAGAGTYRAAFDAT